MKRILPLLLPVALLLACAREDRTGLQRRAISAPAQQGWARLRLDGPAQREVDTLWIGDAEGTPIPFQRERDGLWEPRELELRDLLMGRDDRGRPTAEFGLRLPEGWQVREREHLRVNLRVEGKAPWVARALLARRMEQGAWIDVESPHAAFVYDLDSGHSYHSLLLPWEGERFRITLEAAQGQASQWTGLEVSALTEPEALDADQVLSPKLAPLAPGLGGPERWTLNLPSAERVVALDLRFQPPLAPVEVGVELPPERFDGPERRRPLATGTVWNLPALRTESTRIALAPATTDTLQLRLPPGLHPASAQVLVRREALLFPAEAGQAYFLHSGGRVKKAPGNLGALPSSRQVYGRAALSLGPPEADPQGLGRIIEAGERTRAWLPWAVGGAVLLLLGFAAQLLRGPKPPSPEPEV